MLHHLTFGRTIPRKGGNDYVTDIDWQMYCEEVLDANETGLGTAILNPELGEYVTKVTIYKPNGDKITFE